MQHEHRTVSAVAFSCFTLFPIPMNIGIYVWKCETIPIFTITMNFTPMQFIEWKCENRNSSMFTFALCIFCNRLPYIIAYIIATTSIKYFMRLCYGIIPFHTQHRSKYGFAGRINSLTRFFLSLRCIAGKMVVLLLATKKCIANAYHEHTNIKLVCSRAISTLKSAHKRRFFRAF